VEERLYVDLEAALIGVELPPIVEMLRRLSAGQPAGDALNRRVAAQTDAQIADPTQV
jgi:hypothetical protein